MAGARRGSQIDVFGVAINLMAKIAIKIKRIYEKTEKADGFRVLVDRLWPRGVSKEKAHLDLWLKEVAPSAGLRQWFNHDQKKWKEFEKRYRRELAQNPAFGELKNIIKKHKSVTLLFAAKDEEYNDAIVLKKSL